MKNKKFKSEFSDMKVEVYESGFIAITDAEKNTIIMGNYPNARFDLLFKAIEYVKENEK